MEKTNEIVSELLAKIKDSPKNETLRLPTESELCAQYDTNRATVREALKILQYFNIIKGVRGSGYSVTLDYNSFSETAEKILNLYHFDFKEISEVREALEIKVISSICEEGFSDEDIDFLAQRIQQMKQPGTAAVEADHAFHDKLAEMSGNRLIMAITASIARYIQKYMEEFWCSEVNDRYGKQADMVAAHQKILESIIKKEPIQIKNNPITAHYKMSNSYIMPPASTEKSVAAQYSLKDLIDKGWSVEKIAQLAQEIKDSPVN